MAKKYFQKALSVGLSLALCAGLVAPAFAASFTDLQGAIDNGSSVEGAITVADGADGRIITILEDVEQENGEKYLVVAGEGKNVTLNLDGHSIIGNGTSNVVLVEKNAQLTVNGADANGQKGSITGGGGEITFGGGINIRLGSTAELNDVKVTGNTAGHMGGGLYVQNSNVTLNNAEVSGNEAKKNGGGIYADGKSTVTVKDSDITDNTASGWGGGLFAADATANLNGVTVSGNRAANGGGIGTFANGAIVKSTVTVEGGDITDNTASGWGGGLCASNATANLNGVTVSGNKAANGGGIGAYGESTVTVEGGAITKNEAANHGGGIYTQRTETDIKNSAITKNEAAYYGGGIFAEMEEINIVNSAVTENKAAYDGGGFYINAAENDKPTTVKADGSSVIANNDAVGSGDDIFVRKNATLEGFGIPQGETLTEDGKPITGWYWDGNGAWGSGGSFSYHEYPNINTQWSGDVWLKAAHGQYFGASYYADEADKDAFASIDAEKGVEKGSEAKFTDPSTAPTREGYDFDGWKAVAGVDENGNVTGEVKFVAQWKEAEPEPAEPDPANPAEPDPTVEIDEPEVPLAGLFTRADAIGYLWEQAGEPEAELSDFPDVPEDHQWAVAIGWAQDMGIARADEEGNFRPDDLVLRSVESLEVSPEGELQEFLDRYAVYAGIGLAEGEHFYELDGAFDDVIMGEDAQVIFDAFFAKLGAATGSATAFSEGLATREQVRELLRAF